MLFYTSRPTIGYFSFFFLWISDFAFRLGLFSLVTITSIWMFWIFCIVYTSYKYLEKEQNVLLHFINFCLKRIIDLQWSQWYFLLKIDVGIGDIVQTLLVYFNLCARLFVFREVCCTTHKFAIGHYYLCFNKIALEIRVDILLIFDIIDQILNGTMIKVCYSVQGLQNLTKLVEICCFLTFQYL